MFQTPPGKTKEMTSTEPTTELFSNEALLQLEERLGLTKTALAVSVRLRLAELPVLAQRLEDISRKRAAEDCPRTDNRSLSDTKLSEELRAGRIGRVGTALEALDSGSFL